MAQKIKQGNIFGRVGSGIGQGLAEQLPKEIERNRLSSGLSAFEKESGNMTPIQQMARLSSIPGITPQMIQSFSELAKQGNLRNAYARTGVGTANQFNQSPQSSPGIPSQGMQGIAPQMQQQGIQQQPQQQNAQQMQPRNAQQQPSQNVPESGGPQIVPTNPLDQRNLPPRPWSPEQRNETISNYLNSGFLPDQAKDLAADDESRYMADAEAYRQGNRELEQTRSKAANELTDQLEKKLQLRGDAIFSAIPGPALKRLQQGMERDLRLNPQMTLDDVANKWSDRGLALAKARTGVDKLLKTTGIENFDKGNESVNRIKEYQRIFKDAGDSDGLYNILQTEGGMSPQGAASAAYPLNKKHEKIVQDYKPVSTAKIGSGKFGITSNKENADSASRKAAIEFAESISSDDSPLTMSRELSLKDSNFDQAAFFEQLGEEKDRIGFNARQQQEIAEGPKDIIPSWGDILLLPWKYFRSKQ